MTVVVFVLYSIGDSCVIGVRLITVVWMVLNRIGDINEAGVI